MHDDKPDRLIATIAMSTRERVAVALRSYKGHRFVDVRIQFPNGDEWKWTAKGLGLRADMLNDMIDVLGQAREAARAEGLLR